MAMKRAAMSAVGVVIASLGVSANLAVCALCISCGRPPPRATPTAAASKMLPDFTLRGTDGTLHRLRDEAAHARVTVLEFFSVDCPVQSAHDERLRNLAALFSEQGVRVLAIDSEQGATLERDAAEARSRRYSFPILLDEQGTLATAVGATYATYSLVLDGEGRIRYRGGVDPDRQRLHEDARPYLADAVAALLGGHQPDPAETLCLGCYLRRW